MSGTKGSSGFGSVSIEQIDSRTEVECLESSYNSKQGTQRTLRNRQRGRPLIPQNIQANGTIGVDVGMIDLGRKADLGRLEGVVGRETDREEENTTRIW